MGIYNVLAHKKERYEIPKKYKPGIRITGTVTNVTDFGLFVELEKGIEGLVRVSEITKEKGGNPLSKFNVDDVIKAEVVNVSGENKKIALSIRRLEQSDEKEIYRSYLSGSEKATSNLGDLLKKGMSNLQRKTPPSS